MITYEEKNYDDIINLPHHVSKTHPKMPALDRAAQFSPFAALTGHEEAIKETARRTEQKMELDESSKQLLDEKLWMLREQLEQKPRVCITYFKPDDRKSGGSYETINGVVRKIEEYSHSICMEDGKILSIENIFEIQGELFRGLE